jgi:integrating conjugative element protein (TIGR03765 family)
MNSRTTHRFFLSVCAATVLALISQQACAQATNATSATSAKQAIGGKLIVVADHGGASAQPFYEAIDVIESPAGQTTPGVRSAGPSMPASNPPRTATERDMLPVRSTTLSPGAVSRRTIKASLLRPIFLVGDDDVSRAWLHQRLPLLRQIKATGFVVNVSTPSALQSLRRLASGVSLSPASGDDLGQRLQVKHYPVLITASSIEQ